MTEAERFELVTMLARSPESGEVIQGTGGVRKVRFARRETGKSGGYRIITFFTGPDLPVFLLTMFAKGERADLTQAERNDLAILTRAIVAAARERSVPRRREP